MISVDEFRKAFPVFSDEVVWPDSGIKFWLELGQQLLSPSRFGKSYDKMVYLFTAHNLILDKQGASFAISGGSGNAGAVASKTVGSASISYDTGSSLELDAGHWNATPYGKRFIWLIRLFGAVVMQIP